MGELFDDDEIRDHELEDEIELLAELITAVHGCRTHLTDTEIDGALGLGSACDDHDQRAWAVDAFDSAELDVAGRGRTTDQREWARRVEAG